MVDLPIPFVFIQLIILQAYRLDKLLTVSYLRHVRAGPDRWPKYPPACSGSFSSSEMLISDLEQALVQEETPPARDVVVINSEGLQRARQFLLVGSSFPH
jgi:hypothetical protein